MITRSDFFKALAKGALWDVGVAINRTNPLPLDKFSVFGAYSDGKGDNGTDSALGYAKNSVIAYPGQIIAVVAGTDTEPVTTVYVIKKTGTSAELESLGSSNAISALDTRLTTLEGEVVKTVTGDNAVKATKTGNAVTLATQTSAVEGNILEIKDDGLYVPAPEEVTVPTYRLKNITSSDSPYAAVYHLSVFNGDTEDTSANTGVDINIPKDRFLKSATIVHYDEGNLPTDDPKVTEAGTYIKFVFENVTAPVHLNVKDLIDIYKGGTTTTIKVNVDPNTNTITANLGTLSVGTEHLKDGAVTEPKLADDAVTTAKIKDSAVTNTKIAANAVTEAKIKNDAVTEQKIKNGAVTLDKLSSGVQASLGHADSAIRKVKVNGTELTPDANKAVNVTVTTGTANGHIAVNGVDVKVAGLNSAAYETKESFDHAIADAKKAVLGDPETDTAESNTVHGVKKKAEANANDIQTLQIGLGTKLDRITTGPDNYNLIYGAKKNDTGAFVDDWYVAGTAKLPAKVTVAAYDDDSRLTTQTPKADTDAANKKYVDDAVNTAVSSGVTIEKKGTGNIVTSVTKTTTSGKITVTNASTISINEVADLQTNLDAKAEASDLTALQTTVSDKVDKYHQTSAPGQTTKIYAVDTTGTQLVLPVALTKGKDYEYNTQDPNGLAQYIDNKLYSFTPTDSDNAYVVANKEYVDKVKTDLAVNAVHFKGVVETLPSGDELNNYSAGDIVILGATKKEYILDNNKAWQEIGDESAYIPKNDNNINNYLVNGSIAQSKVNGLTTTLAGKVGHIKVGPSNASELPMTADGTVHINIASTTGYGVVKASTADNQINVNTSSGVMTINSVTTDIIKNGANTLILDGGGAAL